MSGNATQRGELAILDKYLRAEAAVLCGADLVLELPYPWCASSADFFATAAVSIASEVGDTLLFGSECADINLLSEAASYCESDAFKRKYEQYTILGKGSAAAYADCLAEQGFGTLGSNDLLGVSYIRAIKRLGARLVPLTVARRGAAYNEAQTTSDEYQSASAMRAAIENGDFHTLEKFLPRAVYDIICREMQGGSLTDMREAESAVLGYLRFCDERLLKNIADTDGGLENRIISCARQSRTYAELIDMLKTKRYTDAKLRRAVLFCLTSVCTRDLRALPSYTCLLGANETGRALLSGIRKRDTLNVVTKPADVPRDTRQFECSSRLDALYGLARKNRLTEGDFFRKQAYIVK